MKRPTDFKLVPNDGFDGLLEERDRVCTDPSFKRSPLMARLLSYLVDHCAKNQGAGPKSYSIAVDVLGRSEDFDPATDSYPRVMVGRLRTLLGEYYQKTPSAVRLSIPTGGYSVLLVPSEGGPALSPLLEPATAGLAGNLRLRSFYPKVALAAATILLGLLVAFVVWQRPEPPRSSPVGTFTVFVEAGEAIGDGAADDILKAAHSIMTGILVHFDPLAVQTELIELSAEQATAAYRVTIDTSLNASGETELILSLRNLDDEQPIWSRRGNWTEDDAKNNLFLESAASELASGYGVLVRNQLLNRRGEYNPGILCLAHAAEFGRTRESSMIAPLEQCLAASIEAYPERPALYRDALSFLLYAKVERDPVAVDARAQAKKLAEEAFALAGMDSAVANFVMARSYFFERDCYAGSRQLRAAVSKNPADGERMAFGGTYLFICKNPAAKAMLERAVALDGDRASVALVVLAFFELRRNNGEAALALVDRVVPSLRQEPQIDLTRAAALYEVGRRDEAFATMAKLRKRVGADDKMPAERFLGQFISNPQTIKILAAELRKRGLQP